MADNREQQEILAWTNFINSHATKDHNMSKYLPIKTNNQHLIDLTSKTDGFFLRDLIYWCSGNQISLLEQYFENLLPVSQNPNAAKFMRNINYNCCLDAAKNLGITLINISCNHLITGNVKYTLSLIWQLIAQRQKVLITQFNTIREKIVQQGAQQQKNKDISQGNAQIPYKDVKLESMLIQWVNENQSVQVKNLGQAFMDGQVLFELAYNLSYNFNVSEEIITNIDIQQEKQKAPDEVISNAFQLISGLGVELFLTCDDIKSGNSSYTTILLSEMLIRCLELEMTQKKDKVNELDSIDLQQAIQSKKLPLLGQCDYRTHCKFDQYRSQTQITIEDTITTIYNTLELTIKEYALKLFLNQEYQYINNLNNDEKISILQTLIRTLRNVLDILLNKLDNKEGGDIQKIQDSIQELMNILMVVSVENNLRMHIRGIDFQNSIQKMLTKNLNINALLPATYYLEEMTLLTDDKQNSDLASQLLGHFKEQLKLIKDIDQQSAYCYIYIQITNNIQKEIYDQVFTYINMIKTQAYDDQTKYNSLCLLLNIIPRIDKSYLTFEQIQSVYDSTLSIRNKVNDQRLHALFSQVIAEYLQSVGNLYPKEMLEHINKAGIIGASINKVNAYQPSIDVNKQILLLSDSIILKAGRQQINKINNTNESVGQILDQFSKIQKNIHQIYKTIVQDHIGNVIVRRAARNILFAITNINDEVSNTFINTLALSSQVQSQTAFSESLKDMLLCYDYIKDKDELLIKIFDIVLTHANRYYGNAVIAIEAVEFFCGYSYLPIFYSSLAYEQLDSIVEIRLEDRKLAQLYLQMLKNVVEIQPCIQLFDTSINSIIKILNLHQKDSLVMTEMFYLAKSFAEHKQLSSVFMDELSFFPIILEALTFFYQNRDVIKAITDVILQLAENSAACCTLAEQHGVFQFLRKWGKQWKRDTEIINTILKTHAYALFYLDQTTINPITIIAELQELM